MGVCGRGNAAGDADHGGGTYRDTPYANAGASGRHALQVSVADAHIGAVVQAATAERITIITSDPADMRRMTAVRNVTIVTI